MPKPNDTPIVEQETEEVETSFELESNYYEGVAQIVKNLVPNPDSVEIRYRKDDN